MSWRRWCGPSEAGGPGADLAVWWRDGACSRTDGTPSSELEQLSGIAAILRYPMPEIESEDEGSDSDSD